MGLRKRRKDFKYWCPQPPNPLTSKLKRYSAPIAIVLTVTLFTASFSVFYSGYPVNPALPQVIMPLASAAPVNETPPAIEWAKDYAGPDQAAYANAIIQTSDGGYVIAGVTGQELYSVATAWLVKVDPQGNIEWNRTFSFTSGNLTYHMEGVSGFVQTSDGGFALAGTEAWFPSGGMEYATGSEGILLKLDSSGNIEWNQTYPYVNGISSMVQTSDGGYALAGDYSLTKTNSLGIAQWHKSYKNNVLNPNAQNENVASVIQTSDGGYALMTGNGILFKVNSQGVLQWKQTYKTSTSTTPPPTNIIGYPDGGTSAFIQTSDGGYLLAGSLYVVNSSSNFALLIKTNPKGAVEWSKTYGPAGSGAGVLIQTSDGGYAFAGTVPGSGNYPQNLVWLVKTDSTGNLQWSQTNNNTSQSLTDYLLGGAFTVNSLIETKDGGFMIAGSWNPGITGLDNAYYLAKTEPALPPPTATPAPIASLSPPPQTLNPFYILLIVLGVLVAVIVVAAVAVLMFKKKLKFGVKNGCA
jgi:hypothetical protein